MKTKEIDVWIHEDQVANFESGESRKMETWMSKGNSKYFKAKIIIEYPEKKIEISESEFDEAVLESPLQYDYAVKSLKQKLFGND